MGSGDDGVNVRGTSATTNIDTGAGDDLVFVSDAANLGNVADVLDARDLSGLEAWLDTNADRDVASIFEALLHGTVTIDDRTFHGSLDLVKGALNVDTGTGSNTLAVSDRGDAGPDSGFVITAGSISGLSTGAIGYTSTDGDLAGQGDWTLEADSGLFGRGISVFLGSGGNTGVIGSVRGGALGTTPFGATVTTVYTGEGDDDVTITATCRRADRHGSWSTARTATTRSRRARRRPSRWCCWAGPVPTPSAAAPATTSSSVTPGGSTTSSRPEPRASTSSSVASLSNRT